MCAFSVNKTPLMVAYLVNEVRAFESDPVVIFDVGARDGMNSEWAVFGDQIKVYCFEPDEEECTRLTAEAPPQVHYLAYAVGRSTGRATLFETKLPYSTGLYKTRMEYFDRFINWENGITVSERVIDVKSLDDILSTIGIDHIDFIKLDAEGAELDILEGAGKMLMAGNLVGVLSEIRLHREINGSPPFADLDSFLRRYNFQLFDLEVNRHSRKALPYPQIANYRMASGERFFAYTRRGQVQDGDALYFRDYLLTPARSVVDILKVAAFMEIYSLNDCAAELIVANRERLKSIVDPDKLLDLLASGIAGRAVDHRDYLKAYFAEPAIDVEPCFDKQPANIFQRLMQWFR
jgi:FkbM family methyltransferase